MLAVVVIEPDSAKNYHLSSFDLHSSVDEIVHLLAVDFENLEHNYEGHEHVVSVLSSIHSIRHVNNHQP